MPIYITFIFLIILLIYWALIFESASMAMLAFGVALFVLLAFSFLMYTRFQLMVRLATRPFIINAGERVYLPFSIENNTFFKIQRIRLNTKCYNIISDKSQKKWSFVVNVPRGKSQSSIEMQLDEPGRYEVSLRKLYIYDLTGIFRSKLKAPGKFEIIVLPKLSSIETATGMGVKNFYLDTDFYDELRPGNAMDENMDVREYHPGDKLQLIHWRLSAKYDELYIREKPDSKPCAIVLFFDPAALRNRNDDKSYLNVVSSLSMSLMDRKVPHFVSWFSKSRGDIIRARVYDEESFFVFLVNMIQDMNFDNPGSLIEEYKLKYKGDPYIHYVLFDNHNTYLQDDETLPLTNDNLYFYFE